MGEFPRKADGRRVFTPEFKRRVVQQVVKGEKTLAELSRERDIYPTVLRSWKRPATVNGNVPLLSARTRRVAFLGASHFWGPLNGQRRETLPLAPAVS